MEQLKERSFSAAESREASQRENLLMKLFHNLEGFVEIRTLCRDMAEVKRQLFFDDIDRLLRWRPPDNENIRLSIFTRTEKEGSSDFVGHTRAVFADYDMTDLEQIKDRVKRAGLPAASIIIDSGRGYHFYWLLYDKAGREAVPVYRTLARRTGADIQQAGLQAGGRLPGTYNLKEKPVKCRIIEFNNQKYQLDFLAESLGVKARPEFEQRLIEGVSRPCINSILQGVSRGQRNFALGRITKYLQQQGYSKKEGRQIVLAWNRRNDPPEKEQKVKNDFRNYWRKDYKLLGCRFNDNERLQQELSIHCDRYSCSISGKIDSIELDNSVGYNNRLLQDLRKLSGAALLVYGVLSIYQEGLNTDQLENKANISDNTRQKAVKELNNLGYLNFREGIKRRGIKDFYKLNKQGNFKTGRTIVSNGAILGAVHKNITLKQLKVYILLLKYALGKKNCYPNLSTLGKELGISKNAVSQHIKKLEAAGYIKIDQDYQNKAIIKNYYRLLV